MKMRSFAMFVTAGVVACASLAYVAPALADDDNSTQTMPATTDNNNQNQSNDNMSNPSANNPNPSSNNPSSNNSDQATPDTATGDDDY